MRKEISATSGVGMEKLTIPGDKFSRLEGSDGGWELDFHVSAIGAEAMAAEVG